MSAVAALPSIDRFFQLSLLGMLTSGYAAVVSSGALDTPTAVVTGLALLVRLLMVTGLVRFNLPEPWVTVATLAYMAAYPIDYWYVSHSFLTATVHLVFFLTALKTLTASTTRDYFLLKLIAFLELLTATLLPASLNFSVFLACFLVATVATFASAEIRSPGRATAVALRAGQPRALGRLTMLTVGTCLGILMLTGALFLLLPRTARAAFQHLVPQRYHLAGFSGTVTLGDIGELQRDGVPVMHVKAFQSGPLPPWKWRGLALTQFDGTTWSTPYRETSLLPVDRGWVRLAAPRTPDSHERRISYEVRLKGTDSDVLFFPSPPELLQIAAPLVRRTSDDSLHLGFPFPGELRYFASGLLPSPTAPPAEPLRLAVEVRGRYLQLPRLDPRVAELALQVAGAGPPEVQAAALEKHLQTQYAYTLELLPEAVRDPLAHFLFERRKGHCEYFASSMAVMLRTLGIPSRVITGFQGGQYNPVSGWHVIRSSDAHSWVEAFLPSRGWTVFDPTPPQARPPAFGWWNRVQLYMDAAETWWQEWVVRYDLEQQLTLASRMEHSGRSLRQDWFPRWVASVGRQTGRAGSWLGDRAGVIVTFVLAFVAAWLTGPPLWRWWLRRRQAVRVRRGLASVHDATLLYERMLRLLRRHGFDKPSWLTPTEFAHVLPDIPLSALVRQFTRAYQDVRFGNRPEAAATMLELLDKLEATARTRQRLA